MIFKEIFFEKMKKVGEIIKFFQKYEKTWAIYKKKTRYLPR